MAGTHPVCARIGGPIVTIGFGSIGKGTWPLIERFFEYDPVRLTVIEPDVRQDEFLLEHHLGFAADLDLSGPWVFRNVLASCNEPHFVRPGAACSRPLASSHGRGGAFVSLRRGLAYQLAIAL
ncbi:MAG: saccharopine dehydrogenase NADP-binding domain-containing protein [Roseicyclus sp.]|nr:saccharopine dehydrogenase NADP-binding domain-containing protein [Roseicyclus sp.]